MADEEGLPELRHARCRSQLLTDSKRRKPADVVRHLLAVQAQDFPSVPLALRVRSRGLRLSQVHAALDSGELIIGWLNRGTLHLVCREDYWWLHALTTPQLRANSRRRLAEEGVTGVERRIERLAKLLEHGPMLRKDIGVALGVKAGGLTHTLFAASIEGLVVRGPVRGREQTFVLAHDHIGAAPPIDREAAVKELGIRYAAGHSSATRADLAYWAGVPQRDARPPEQRLSRVRTGDKLGPRLLPAFDPYIMGWKERSFVIPTEHTKQVIPGGGMFRAVVLDDGLAVATWSRAGGRVTISPFERDVDGLAGEISDVERFLAG